MNPERYEQRILRVQLYIQENLDGDLSLESLADVAQRRPTMFVLRLFPQGKLGVSYFESHSGSSVVQTSSL